MDDQKRIAADPPPSGERPATGDQAESPPPFSASLVEQAARIFALLRAQTGHDFADYKQNTVLRRIERRMAARGVDDLGDYARVLEGSRDEVEALFRDLLIGVTGFFRDGAPFAALQTRALPSMLAGKSHDEPVRVWVPGCSTGEEAYSIAMLLWDHLDASRPRPRIQIFATDIDPRAIERARAGVYARTTIGDVSEERLERHFSFDRATETLRVRKHIRDLLVFSEHDVLRSPPFSKLDLLSCRNLLIYLGAELQKRLMSVFHYALRPGGFLLLGTSESVGSFADSFESVDSEAKLYRRVDPGPSALSRTVGTHAPRLVDPAHEPVLRARTGRERKSLRALLERALLDHFEAVGILVDGRGEILYLHGRTGDYLEPAPGAVAVNILRMAREGLRHDLALALGEAVSSQHAVRRPALKVRTSGAYTVVDLTVRRVTFEGESEPNLYLVVLEKTGEGRDTGRADGRDVEVPLVVDVLREQLAAKDDHLRAANAELEISNEDLRSTNEELQSMNEELQSTNEELETSKEELQSVNEELGMVNVELQEKVVDLSRANNDMNNLLAGTGIGTVFVDHDLCIQRFTPDSTKVIPLIGSDVGRPIGDLVSHLTGYDRLVEDARLVLDSLIPKEIEVQTRAGSWYSLRIRPYRTTENVIEGAVITFIEISEIVRARAAQRETETLRRLAVVVRDASDAITVRDLNGRIIAWNPGAQRLYGWTEAEALEMSIEAIVPPELRDEELGKTVLLGQAEALAPYETRRITRDRGTVFVTLFASALVTDNGRIYAIATTEREREIPKGSHH